MSVGGAIVTQRCSDGNCLLLETLQLHHTVKVYHVWKLFQKTKRPMKSTQATEELDVNVPKKKKRKGKKQNKCFGVKRSHESPLQSYT
jgi:hypothetical protein